MAVGRGCRVSISFQLEQLRKYCRAYANNNECALYTYYNVKLITAESYPRKSYYITYMRSMFMFIRCEK